MSSGHEPTVPVSGSRRDFPEAVPSTHGEVLLPTPFPLPHELTTITPGSRPEGAQDAEPDLDLVLPPRYDTSILIGRGGQGQVFLGHDAVLQRRIAIKICTSGSPTALDRFTGEARTMACLDHPGIIPIFDAGDRFLAMKLLTGHNLNRLITRQRGISDLVQATEILIHVCHAIEFAHERGIIHRDLKADNIQIGEHGEVTVLDWGIACGLEHGHLPKRWRDVPVVATSGTPWCMPPEVALGDAARIGTAADVWMIGAILYHVMTGRMPYEGLGGPGTIIEAASRCAVPPVIVSVPAKLTAIQQSAMHPDPAQRPSVAQVREHLRAWLLQSGNIDAARNSIEIARLLIQRAQLSNANDRDTAVDCYAQAMHQFERARSLDPDEPTIVAEHEAALQRYVTFLVRSGEVSLARFLIRNYHHPRLRTASSSQRLAVQPGNAPDLEHEDWILFPRES